MMEMAVAKHFRMLSAYFIVAATVTPFKACRDKRFLAIRDG